MPHPFFSGMLVVPHRIVAGQRFGFGSGAVDHDVKLVADPGSFTTVT